MLRSRILAVTLLAALVTPAWAGDLDEVKAKLRSAFKELRSLRGKISNEVNMEMPGFSMKSSDSGTYEFIRRDGKMFSRVESTGKSTRKMGDQEMNSDTKSLMIIDGEMLWTLNEMDGQTTATKMKYSQDSDEDPLAGYDENFNIKLLPEEKINGHDCYVFEITPKDAMMNSQMSRSVVSFTKQYGVTTRVITYGADGKPVSTMQYTDMEFNVDLSPDRFRFKAPEGVEVMDMDAMGQYTP